MATDPWEQAAKDLKAAPTAAGSSSPATNDDWKVWQQGPSETSTATPWYTTIGNALGNFAEGAGKGIASTSQGIENLLAPRGSFFNSDPEVNTTPSNTTQSIGKGLEQIGEFLIPGAGEEEAGELAARLAPKLGKAAAPLGRIATSAIGSGLVNKAQGGNFSTGAEMGAAGGALGEGLKAIAPTLAESALNVRGADRSYGANPGVAILEHTSGITPKAVTKSAGKAISSAKNSQRALAALGTIPVDLTPAANEATNQAIKLGDQVFQDPEADMVENRLVDPFSSLSSLQVPASKALNIRTGIGKLGKWNELQPGTQALSEASKPVYREATNAIHSLPIIGPQIAEQDALIHSLLPVEARANAADLNAGILQKSLNRFARPTGALIGSSIGGEEGYRRGGLPGLVAGIIGGAAVPELLTSPTTQMLAARTLKNAPKFTGLAPGALGAIRVANQ